MKRTEPTKHTVESGQQTASRILDAAEALLAEAGFDGMSVGGVAQAAEVNKALVFYHFKSKAGLMDAVLARYYDAHLDTLRAAFEGAQGHPRSRLHAVVDAYFAYIAQHQRYPRIIQQQVATAGTTDLIRQHLEPLFRWTEEALAALLPAAGPLAARQFFVSFSGLVINYFTYAPVLAGLWPGDPLGTEAIAERRDHVHWIMDRVLDGLGAEAG
ncbi:MAG: TetR/AcrR family transcriptional regulator [bacterium]